MLLVKLLLLLLIVSLFSWAIFPKVRDRLGPPKMSHNEELFGVCWIEIIYRQDGLPANSADSVKARKECWNITETVRAIFTETIIRLCVTPCAIAAYCCRFCDQFLLWMKIFCGICLSCCKIGSYYHFCFQFLPHQPISSINHSCLGSLPKVSKKNLQQLLVWDVYLPDALPITQLQCQNTEGIDKRLSQLQS